MARKLKYETPEALQAAIDAYFADCEGHPLTDAEGQPLLDKFGNPIIIGAKPLTVTGLALALGFATRQSLLDYQGRAEFKTLIQQAKLRIENYAEMRLYDKDGWNGARFNLQNNFRHWDADKASQEGNKGPAVKIIYDIPRTEVPDEAQNGLDPVAVSEAIKDLERKDGGSDG